MLGCKLLNFNKTEPVILNSQILNTRRVCQTLVLFFFSHIFLVTLNKDQIRQKLVPGTSYEYGTYVYW